MKKALGLVLLALPAMIFGWIAVGCMNNHGAPMAPTRSYSLTVTASSPQLIKGKLLGAARNVILYEIDSPGQSPVTGSTGSFSTPGDSGSFTFTIPRFTASGSAILSLQLNDASGDIPLAVGAAPLVSAGAAAAVNVELGSIIRNCYNTSITGGAASIPFGFGYSFAAGTVDPNNSDLGSGLDIRFASTVVNDSNVFDMKDADTGNDNDIAYLGNGNLVDFDLVPPDSAFKSSAAQAKGTNPGGPILTGLHAKGGILFGGPGPMAAGDVYCVKLSSIPGAHAWIQITDSGQWGSRSPAFCFRVNSTKPYYAYEQTQLDLLGGCSGGTNNSANLNFTLDYEGQSLLVDGNHQLVTLLNQGFKSSVATQFQVFSSNDPEVGYAGIAPGRYLLGFVYGFSGVPYPDLTANAFVPHVGDIYGFYNPAGAMFCFSGNTATGNLPVTAGTTSLGAVTLTEACTFTGSTGQLTYGGSLVTPGPENQLYVAAFPDATFSTPFSQTTYSSAGRYDSPDVSRPTTVSQYYLEAWLDVAGIGGSTPTNGDPITTVGPVPAGAVTNIDLDLEDSNLLIFTPTPTQTETLTPTVTPTPTVTTTPTITPTLEPFVSPVTEWGSGDGTSFSGPIGLAVDSTGATVFVGDTPSLGRVEYFSSSGSYQGRIFTTSSPCSSYTTGCFTQPYGMAFDGLGNLYITDFNSYSLEQYSAANFNQISHIGQFQGPLGNPIGVAVDSNNQIYISSFNGKVLKYDGSSGAPTTQVAAWNSSTAGTYSFGQPWELAVDSSDNVYVADAGLAQVEEFSSSGSLVRLFGATDGMVGPRGVAVCNGCSGGPIIYVSDTINNRIMKYGPTGTLLAQWGGGGTAPGNLSSPYMIAVDPSGNIYVADSGNNRVQKFPPQ